jgi:putative aldouronate transport system substrate-binding protein
MVLALILTACSGKKDSGNSNSGSNNQGTTSTTTNTNTNSDSGPTQDKVEFTMFVAVEGEKDLVMNETKIGKILEEQTGVNWKIEYLSATCRRRSAR